MLLGAGQASRRWRALQLSASESFRPGTNPGLLSTCSPLQAASRLQALEVEVPSLTKKQWRSSLQVCYYDTRLAYLARACRQAGAAATRPLALLLLRSMPWHCMQRCTQRCWPPRPHSYSLFLQCWRCMRARATHAAPRCAGHWRHGVPHAPGPQN